MLSTAATYGRTDIGPASHPPPRKRPGLPRPEQRPCEPNFFLSPGRRGWEKTTRTQNPKKKKTSVRRLVFHRRSLYLETVFASRSQPTSRRERALFCAVISEFGHGHLIRSPAVLLPKPKLQGFREQSVAGSRRDVLSKQRKAEAV